MILFDDMLIFLKLIFFNKKNWNYDDKFDNLLHDKSIYKIWWTIAFEINFKSLSLILLQDKFKILIFDKFSHKIESTIVFWTQFFNYKIFLNCNLFTN